MLDIQCPLAFHDLLAVSRAYEIYVDHVPITSRPQAHDVSGTLQTLLILAVPGKLAQPFALHDLHETTLNMSTMT